MNKNYHVMRKKSQIIFYQDKNLTHTKSYTTTF